jgi:hypothetical protein
MGLINPALPVPSDPRGDEETVLASAVQSLLAEFNGNVDLVNFSSSLQAAVNGVAAPLVTSLPTSPVDGQIARLLVGDIVWTFRHRNAASGYKWEFLGGPPRVASWVGSSSGSGTYSVFNGFEVFLPNEGDYLVTADAIATHVVGSSGENALIRVGTADFVSPYSDGAAGFLVGSSLGATGGVNLAMSCSRSAVVSAEAGQSLKFGRTAAFGSITLLALTVAVTPIRLLL